VDDTDDPFVAANLQEDYEERCADRRGGADLVGLAAIATTLSDSTMVGQVFSVGLVVVLAVLLAASAAVLGGAAVFSFAHAAASAFFVAAWAGESVPAGESRALHCWPRSGWV
jgi:hypothetical protein